MEVKVKSKKDKTLSVAPLMQASLADDLKSCMRCRFFYGNDRRCIIEKCIKESEEFKYETIGTEHKCHKCPYKQNEGYCFPCMKKVLGSHKI